jgi:UDP-glucose 4-epimerase
VRDYIHVTDLADAHMRALRLLGGGRKLNLNLGANAGYSVLELVEAVKRVTGRDFDVKLCGRRPGDPAVLVGANGLAREVLGWTPEYSDLDRIVETAWKWKTAHPDGYAELG